MSFINLRTKIIGKLVPLGKANFAFKRKLASSAKANPKPEIQFTKVNI